MQGDFLEFYAKAAEATHEKGRDPLRWFVGEAKVGQAAPQCREGDFRFDARQAGAKTVVDAMEEAEMWDRAPGYVETVGVGKLRGVAVGGANEQGEAVAFADIRSAELSVLANAIGPLLDRSVVAQQLVDGAGQELRPRLEQRPLRRRTQQRPHGEAKKILGRYMAGEEQENAVSQQIVISQARAPRGDELAEDIGLAGSPFPFQ